MANNLFRTTRAFVTTIALSAIALLTACQQPQEAAAPVSQPGIDSPALGLRVASVPAPFSVDQNSGETLTLQVAETSGGGRLEFVLGPVTTSGIILIDEVKQREATYNEMPDGTFHGQVELQGPNGPAYTARGSFPSDSGRTEESWIFSIHPSQYRLLALRYEYPQGEDTPDRMNQLMELFGEVEGLEVEGLAEVQ